MKPWGGDIAVITEKFVLARDRNQFSLALLDEVRGRVVPFDGPPCDTYDDIAYTAALGRLLVCGVGEEARLLQVAGSQWVARAHVTAGRGVRVTADDHYVVLASERELTLFSASTFEQLASMPAPPRNVQLPPSALLIDGNTLLVGYDAGEFGGGLYRYDLAGPPLPPTVLANENARGLYRDRSGAIWAVTGLAHLGMIRGGIYQVVLGSTPQAVATNSGVVLGSQTVNYAEQGVPLPGLTDIVALAEDAVGRLLIVMPQYGLHVLDGDRLSPVYRGALAFGYRAYIDPEHPHWASAGPVAIALGRNGEVFVASRSLGVLKLPRHGRTHVLTQCLFEKADRPSPGSRGRVLESLPTSDER